jgi:hypothetical protein
VLLGGGDEPAGQFSAATPIITTHQHSYSKVCRAMGCRQMQEAEAHTDNTAGYKQHSKRLWAQLEASLYLAHYAKRDG